MSHRLKLQKQKEMNIKYLQENFVIGKAYEVLYVDLRASNYANSPDPLVVNFKLNCNAKGFFFKNQPKNDPSKVLDKDDVSAMNDDIKKGIKWFIVHEGFLEGKPVIILMDIEDIKTGNYPIFEANMSSTKSLKDQNNSPSSSFEGPSTSKKSKKDPEDESPEETKKAKSS